MLNNSDGYNTNDIAIVGMALRVPGARNVDEFWKNLRGGTESIRRLSAEELLEAGASNEAIHDPNFVPFAADMPDMEMFDAQFFGMSAKEAAVMDPQHRQFLECAWEALEDAGHVPDASSGPVGVFAGCGMGSYFYFNVCSNKSLVDQTGMFLLRHTGNDKDFLATRASFAFDLRGPSVSVQTACSTSLVAIHYACQSLLNGECDAALAGGVTIELPARRGYQYQEGEILSPDGHCRPFDHRAAGTVFGSGVGVVVLRRLSDALAEGDAIHGVIKATAINNDGSSKAGYLAPSASGQAAVIVEAMAIAGVDPQTIQYVECHGTGTALGDPIEIDALTQAYRQSTDKVGYCHVGSVKSNIGHLDTAAGVVGVIKTVLALKHGEIPPTLGFERPNPAIDFATSPFLVSSTLAAWPETVGARRAAVNSLGVGGTNAHAILEQAPYVAREKQSADGAAALVLSGRSPAALDDAAQHLARWLASNRGASIGDASHTLLTRRKRFEHSRIVPVRDHEDAVAALADPARWRSQARLDAASGAVFLFPGGGAQYRGMAASLYRSDPGFRATVDEGLSVLAPEVNEEIRAAWFADVTSSDKDPLLLPSVQLPAILIVEVAIARMWIRAGVTPEALIGHSMGENAAACIAGVIAFSDAVRLVRLRGELFDGVAAGGMLSVPMDEISLRAMLPDALDLASVNAPGLAVVSGRNADLAAFADSLADRDINCVRIPIDIAAHSRMLEPILPRWESFLRGLVLRAPQIPIISNVTGEQLTDAEAMDPMYWVRHLRSTVEFAKGMARLTQDPHRVYIEVGPGKTLSTLTKAQGTVKPDQVINSLPHADEVCDDALYLLGAMARARVAGLAVETDVLCGSDGPRRHVQLPPYPFQHRRYFIEAQEPSGAQAADQPIVKEPDLARWGWRPVWKRSAPDYESGAEAVAQTWLIFTSGEETETVAKRLRGLGHRVVSVTIGDAYARKSETEHVLCPELGLSGYTSLFQNLEADGLLPTRIVHGWLLGSATRAGLNTFHGIQDKGFYSLLNIAKALGDLSLAAGVHITILTRSVHRVADEAVVHPDQATIFGPGLVIPREFPDVTIRLVDLESGPTAIPVQRRLFSRPTPENVSLSDQSDLLWEDLLAAPQSEVVAYRRGKRWTRSYSRVALDAELATQAPLRKGGVYLFTGGLGDLATALARRLAQHYQACIVLVGRADLPPQSDWKTYRRQHRTNGITKGLDAISSIESSGGEVLYCSADVTDAVSMREALSKAIERFGRIDGVFHAAGIVDDGLVSEKTIDSIENVLAPKMLGTAVLDEVLHDINVDFLMLFSSTSTVTAPAGQVDYVAANAYLDAYANSVASRSDRRTISLHWGIWNEVGLAARATGISVENAATIDEPAAGPFYERWEIDEAGRHCLAADVSPSTHWMLDEHRLKSGEAVLPGTAYFELLAQAAREHGLPDRLEILDLVMLRPLLVRDDETKTLRTALEACDDGWRVTLSAGRKGESFVRHAEAILKVADASPAGNVDLQSLMARFEKVRRASAGETLVAPQENHICFGPRWRVLQSERMGKTEAVAELALRPEHHADLENGVRVHPALLDIATGFAMELVAGFRDSDVLWVPASYGAVRLWGPLPARIISHVVSVPATDYGVGYAAFDVSIFDVTGKTVFEAKRFLMRRLEADTDFLLPEAGQGHVGSASLQSGSPKLAAQVRQGILPEEGFEMMIRALGADVVEPIISSIDLTTLMARAAVATEQPSASASPHSDDAGVAEARNPIEASLCGYWRDLLGTGNIGIHDNFFDLGGHSLIAVRLFRTIRKEYGVDLPISTLFSAPTIAECAELIAAQTKTAANEPVSEDAGDQANQLLHVTLMHAGAVTTATPVFVCAGMFGNILNLRYLAMQLGVDRPVYGLQARGLYGDMEPHERFEDMARDYLQEIVSVQPTGPYLLAGYSGGGITALEIARQLRQRGEQVAQLVMLDTPQPTQPPLSVLDKASMKVQDLRRHGLGYLQRWLKARAQWREERARKMRTLSPGHQGTEEVFNNERIEQAFYRALARYEVAAYDGALTLYKPKPQICYRLADGRRLMENRNIVLDDNGWRTHVPQVDVVEVPGDHDSMVLEPNVRALARHMRRVLSRVPMARAKQEAGRVETRTANVDRRQPEHV